MAFWNKDKKESDAPASGTSAPSDKPGRPLAEAARPAVTIPISAAPALADHPSGVSKVKNIIAVGSGKGGVGKSTVAVNLAVALAKQGVKVGLLDADVYGPSQPGMLGASREKLSVQTGQAEIKPLEAHGVRFMSIGLLMQDDGPLIWRAPMAMKLIQQFLGGVAWSELDYLFIDMPPGTGDIQLTLAQQAALTGAVIVTTPQDVALGIARKGLQMFQSVHVPILGIAENMSGFHCHKCGEINNIFKEGGGMKMAQDLRVPFLGSVPLDSDIVESGDAGQPVIVKSPGAPSAKAFLSMATELMRQVEVTNKAFALQPQEMGVDPQGRIHILWTDGHDGLHSPHHLRVNCTCAGCVSEDTGERLLDPKRVPLDIAAKNFNPVGRYGLAIMFSDGHGTGIYTFEHLRGLCECAECLAKRGAKAESFSV